jgi:hypothetical protein
MLLINLAITGHWIDSKFRLQQELLAFTPLEGGHTGEYMASIVFDTLEEFDIKEKFFCVTSDSASNNIKMVKELSKILLAKCNIKWDWKTNHIPCLAHIINLVVQKFLKTRLGSPYRTSSNRTEPYRAFASRTESRSQCSRSVMYGSNNIRAEPN